MHVEDDEESTDTDISDRLIQGLCFEDDKESTDTDVSDHLIQDICHQTDRQGALDLSYKDRRERKVNCLNTSLPKPCETPEKEVKGDKAVSGSL